jgi:acyl-CoA thioesterase I
MTVDPSPITPTDNGNYQSRPGRVVVLADSLALPRGTEPHEEIVRWEDTWPSVLERILKTRGCSVEVINCGKRDRTVESLLDHEFYEHVTLKRPHVLVIQIGVSDCAPRIFSRLEKKLLNVRFVPSKLRDHIIKRRSGKRASLTARNPLAKVHVPLDTFRDCLRRFSCNLAEMQLKPTVLWVPIVGDFARMDAKSPGFSSNVAIYNNILCEFVQDAGQHWIEWATNSDFFWQDGYHLSVAGNTALAAKVADELQVVVFSSHAIKSF